MRVLVTASAHFAMTPDRALWIDSATMGYRFWARYLDVFDEVRLLVRTRPTSRPPDGWTRATGAGIAPIALPDSVGPWGFAKTYGRIAHAIRGALHDAEAVLIRLPCHIGGEVWRRLPTRRPYGVEVIADPYNGFAPGAVTHPLRPLFRWWFTRSLRSQCARACAAAYVTERALQHRYPPGRDAFASFYSGVELRDDWFVTAPRSSPPRPDARLLFVGSLAQLYKAPDVLIDAVATCIGQGLDIRLRIVGDGKHRPELEARATTLGVQDRVAFRGHLATAEHVRQELDWADVFVLPSKTEGLPRAMIEAMARGLPCIGSTVGGIPELLPTTDMVPPGHVPALARKICEVITTPERMPQMSSRNLVKAREFSPDVLRPRRISHYEHLRSATSRWLERRAP
jgi:glycosyltransferase involved in cell wall biosynthesis